MAHCPPELLDDLAALLAELRAWPGMVEKSPAVFYLRRAPFLHFHLTAEGRRRADVKGRSGWVPVDVPRPISATGRRGLLRALRACYAERHAPARATPRASAPARRQAPPGRP